MALITLDAAKAHLRIDGTDSDIAVTSKLAQAVSIVADYVESDEATLEGTYGEDGETFVHAAVLLCLTELFDNRSSDPLTPAVMSLLARVRSAGVW